jgi:hypothetical protein
MVYRWAMESGWESGRDLAWGSGSELAGTCMACGLDAAWDTTSEQLAQASDGLLERA